MIVNLAIGFQNLTNPSAKNPKKKNYAVFLADTVLVSFFLIQTQVNDGVPPTLLTDCDKQLSAISYTLSDEEENDASASNAPTSRRRGEDKARSEQVIKFVFIHDYYCFLLMLFYDYLLLFQGARIA